MAALAEELVDVPLLPAAESAALMLALVVVPMVLVVPVASAALAPVLPLVDLLLLEVLLPLLLGSVVVALLSVALAADVVSDSELVSMVASALVPLAQVPLVRALEASLELELTPLS